MGYVITAVVSIVATSIVWGLYSANIKDELHDLRNRAKADIAAATKNFRAKV